MSTVMEQLEHLKKTIHPEKQLNIIDQCRIVHEALQYGSPYEGDVEGVADYLEISKNQLYKMRYTYSHLIPELLEWFRGTEYQCHTAYDVSVLSVDAQREWLRGMELLVSGGCAPRKVDVSAQKVITGD